MKGGNEQERGKEGSNWKQARKEDKNRWAEREGNEKTLENKKPQRR